MMTPAPSPMMNPSRSLSKGRLAFSGSSLRVDIARIAANPPTLIGVIAASEPPAIIASASPRRMISNDSPTACADAEHAVQVARFGPLAPKRIDTCPAARLMIDAGMKNGEIFRGPPASSASCSRSMLMKPPIPEPTNTPTRPAFSSVIGSPASSIASCDAAMANWMKMSIFLTSFFSTHRKGSKPLTSPAMRASNAVASKRVIRPMPVWPEVNARQFTSFPIPRGDTSPMPVTTTRLVSTMLFFSLGVRVDVFDRFLDARDFFGVLVGDLDTKLFLESHDQLDRIERIGAEVVDKRCVRRHFFFVDAKLLHDDALHFFSNRHSILLRIHAAVDCDDLPRNIRRFVRGEKADRVRDVFGRTQ